MGRFLAFIAEAKEEDHSKKYPHLVRYVHGNFSQNSGGQEHHARASINRHHNEHHEVFAAAEKELAAKHGKDTKKSLSAGMDTELGKYHGLKHARKALDKFY